MKVILKEARCKLGEEEDKRRQIERAVMENSYMKELQKTQLHRKQEAERLREEAEELKKQIEVQDLTVGAGTEMYKVGAHGDAKLTTVVLEKVGLEWVISWKSKRKKDDEAQMKISTCTLHFGLRHGNFKLRPEFQKKFANSVRRSFSLLSDARSLDLVCQTREDMEAWKKVFYRSGFPLKNAAQVAAHRRRIEKKKTVRRRERERETRRGGQGTAILLGLVLGRTSDRVLFGVLGFFSFVSLLSPLPALSVRRPSPPDEASEVGEGRQVGRSHRVERLRLREQSGRGRRGQADDQLRTRSDQRHSSRRRLFFLLLHLLRLLVRRRCFGFLGE